MSPSSKLEPLTATTIWPSLKVGVMEEPYICRTGSHRVATSTAIAATIIRAATVLRKVLP